MHFYLQKYAFLPTTPFPVLYSICLSVYLRPRRGKLWLCGGGLSSHSESVTEGRWCMAAWEGKWDYRGVLIAPTFYSVQESRSAHSKSKTYSCTLCIQDCITSNHCHAFCSSFLLVLKNVAEMHNLSSTVHHDAIRKYISRIAVCCVSCVIALVRCILQTFFTKCCVVLSIFLAQCSLHVALPYAVGMQLYCSAKSSI